LSGAEIDTRDKLAIFIKQECEQHWKDHQTPLPLTALGSRIRRNNLAEGTRLENLAPEGLLRFVQTSLLSDLTLRERSPGEGSWAIVPHSIAFTDNLFPRRTDAPGRTLTTSSDRSPSYLPSVWAAFKNSLDEGKKRFLAPDFTRFVDLDAETAHPAGYMEVDRAYLAPSTADGLPPDGRTIKAVIQKFVDKKSIPIDQVIRSQLPPITRERITPSGDNRTLAITADTLVNAIERLSYSDLARIAVPLDIVIEMLRHRR
jgi:hypothetical protein